MTGIAFFAVFGMSASSTPSPMSASSPHFLAPAHPLAGGLHVPPSPSPSQNPSIITRKEWIIPPRPKPGRKPAADTPPTKRKAQNRAAQRAFRERRAARVGDLEEQMRQMEEREEKEQGDLRERIEELQASVKNYNQLLLSWREKYEELETQFERERRLRSDAERTIGEWRQGTLSANKAVVLPQQNPPQALIVDHSHGSTADNINASGEAMSLGCGGCSRDSRCECIEQALEMNNITVDSSNHPTKRPPSAASSTDTNRQHPYPSSNPENLEIDFTSRFSAPRPPGISNMASTVSALNAGMPDPCGFCQDGTPCICAEIRVETIAEASRTSGQSMDPSRMHSSMNLGRSINPPSANANPCVNGPGTCAQCLASPSSTLFCKSLAATRPNAPMHNINAPLLHNANSFVNVQVEAAPAPAESNTGPTITCADTFTTLSRHPAFDRASAELGTWMPQLSTAPGGVARTAFEVEAASVMGVLRFFDRRFGHGTRQ